jgi:hypothetical protein
MFRELLLSTVLAATWLTLSFLLCGVLYGLAGSLFGPFQLMAWEESLGTIRLWNGMSIGRVSVWMYGIAVFVSVLPVNYYWLRRLHRQSQ